MLWNDGSLGCPEPGMAYIQVQIKGYWIVLSVNGETYDYRATSTGHFSLCENGLPLMKPPGGTPEL